jgi:hypothetical protein
VINAAGYNPDGYRKTSDDHKRKTVEDRFAKESQITKVIAAPPEGKIIPLPANVTPPPVQEAKVFKQL